MEINCDRVACGFGLVPNTELGQLLGCALTPASSGARALAVDGLQATSVAGIYAAGECTGVGGSERALAQGRIAGLAAVETSAAAQRHGPERAHWQAFADQLHRHFTLAPSLKNLARPDTLVCRCEDVPQAALAGCGGWTEAKLHTRCGMIAIELFENGDLARPDAALTKRVVAEAARRGLILLSCGTYGNVIRILVPLTASDALLDEGLKILADSFAATR